ncbi:IclR family transcriptional regulator [Rhodovulum sp. 12E13]|uniref:HTH-type transcriptional regulator BhcR n=1 Tax=Rhodovulum sp. 12E13 TaxID=2203891 RepID=UPI000E11C151|nr:HTH-type transcriptional regulator BhcR [Rhodovulum sp. 12E13]RDC70957.1 IclR family transcriptional regulator [Rhodovulum sp. 12E13]
MDDSTPTRRPRGRPRAFSDKTEQNTIQSLDRAMGVLEGLAEAGAATLTELAGATGQSPATVYRVLVTLETRGIVELRAEDQTWAVGPRAFLIGSSFLRRASVVERARVPMRHLRDETGETANLGVPRGDEVMFVSQVETHASLRAFFPPGTLSPLHASGIGKALLAWFDAPRRAAYLAEAELTRFTGHTITSPDALAEDLERIRVRGYALDDEEKAEGMRCVAAPVFDATGEAVAGLSVSGPVSRVTPDNAGRLGAQVARAAAELSAALGAPTRA